MRREHSLLLLTGLSLISLLAGLAACGGSGKLHTAAPQADGNAAGPAESSGELGSDAPRNLLRLSVPELSGLAPGSELEVTLDLHTVEPLYQASARLLFDPAQLEPLSAQTGRFGQSSVALARADRSLRMDGRGYVPFAFTSLPGSGALAPQQMELLRVRFRVLAPISGNAGLRLHNDPGYLQLRGPDNRRLSFDLSEEVAAR